MSQRELRRAAAEKFMESLDQLESRLIASEPRDANQPPAPVEPIALEDAAADIEQFMQELDKS